MAILPSPAGGFVSRVCYNVRTQPSTMPPHRRTTATRNAQANRPNICGPRALGGVIVKPRSHPCSLFSNAFQRLCSLRCMGIFSMGRIIGVAFDAPAVHGRRVLLQEESRLSRFAPAIRQLPRRLGNKRFQLSRLRRPAACVNSSTALSRHHREQRRRKVFGWVSATFRKVSGVFFRAGCR